MTARRVQALRGAITVDQDTPTAILEATTELLRAMMVANAFSGDDVISAFFTSTSDLTAEFPAKAAREMGWVDIAMLCTLELPVPGSLSRCVRAMIHVERSTTSATKHVYLRGAAALRPDRST